MIKLNRTTEYGLIALRHMSQKALANSPEITSAREIADAYGLPFEITAKTLQRLKDTGLIQSEQGARGGYTLQRALSEVSLSEFVALMEGPQGIMACATCECQYGSKCDIQHMMHDLNRRVYTFLSGIKLAELGALPVPEDLKGEIHS
ncbi:Rrf2 family transcriptional regulator [Bdellovibrionota bacterium FG-2]